MSKLLEQGIAAADSVVSSLLRRTVSKALDPLVDRDYVVIVHRLTSRLEGVAKDDEAAAIAAALDTLDVRWGAMGSEALDRVVGAANAVLRKRVAKIPEKIEAVLEFEGPSFTKNVKASSVKTFKLGISADLSARDVEVEEILRRTTTNFIRDEMGRRADALSARARNVVAASLKDGLGSAQIGENLKRALGSRVVKSDAYWRGVAGSFTAHARTFQEVASIDEAGFEEIVFEAVLDEATTSVCRLYHGKVFKTATVVKHVERITEVEEPEDVLEVAPWVQLGADKRGEFLYVRRKGKNVRIADVVDGAVGRADDTGKFKNVRSDAQLVRMGIVTPPLHGHCRSLLLPV